MLFSIILLPDKQVIDSFNEIETPIQACFGTLKIGDFQEQFTASLCYWNPSDYNNHWHNSLRRIIYESDISCLITSMVKPTNDAHIFWWPMYRIENTLFIQNQILFLNQLPTPFNEKDPFFSIPKRETINEDGHKISEWSIPISAVQQFFKDNWS